MPNCREFFKCEKTECPSYKTGDAECWLCSGTQCRDEIQGKFIEKMEMCLNCPVFEANMDSASIKKTFSVLTDQLKEYKELCEERDRELGAMNMELSNSLSEVFNALKKISTGDPTVRIDETSSVELIENLKHIVNLTAADIGEMVDQAHEFAMALTELFDVLHKVSKGDLTARVSMESKEELLEALKNVTNEMICNISEAITMRRQAEEDLKKLATTDNLTGAYNRRKFEEIRIIEIERVKRYHRPLSMIMIDIDHFKEVNDRYGHNAGDYVLKTLAGIIKQHIRKVDSLVRWGGEEFLIISSETDSDNACALAEKLRKIVEDFKFDDVGTVTVSLGVTEFKESDMEDSFIKRADDAMYKAKEKGRNRVEVNA